MKEREIVTYDPENDNIGDKLKAVLDSNNHEKILVFNKASGAFMSEMVSNPINKPDQSTHYKYRVVNFNSETHAWNGGDYDTGNIIPKEDIPTTILEEDIDVQAGMVIVQSYPYYSQLNIIANVVQKLADVNGIEGEEVKELNDMLTFIGARKEANAKFKNTLIQSLYFFAFLISDILKITKIRRLLPKKLSNAKNDFNSNKQ